MRSDPEVAKWVADENAVTERYLSVLPQRDWFRERIRELLDHPTLRNPGEGRTALFLHAQHGPHEPGAAVRARRAARYARVCCSIPIPGRRTARPRSTAGRPRTAARYLAYQRAGRRQRLANASRCSTSPPARCSTTNCAGPSSPGSPGRATTASSTRAFRRRRRGPTSKRGTTTRRSDFHRVGTAQAADELVYATPDHPEYGHTASVTSDGRYAIISSSIGTDARHELHLIDLAHRDGPGWQPRVLVAGFEHDWKLVDSIGSRLWFVTNKDAPRYRVVTVDLAAQGGAWRTVVGAIRGDARPRDADRATSSSSTT